MPGQDPGREIGRVDDAVAHDEDVLARAVGDGALRREQDRLVVAGVVRLGDREHRVEVDARRLRDVRDDVRRHALPGRDLRADAVLQALLAEVRRPRPAHDHDLDGVAARRDAELAVAVERDRPDVALGQPVGADQLVARRLQLVDRVRDLHVEELRRVVQALEVLVEAEDRRSLRGVVAADPLEDAGAVVQSVHADVDLRVGPVDELAVHPDLLGLLQRALLCRPPGGPNSTQWPRGRPCAPRPGGRARPAAMRPCDAGFRPRSRRRCARKTMNR